MWMERGIVDYHGMSCVEK